MKIALLVPGGVDRSGNHRVIPCLLALVEHLMARGDEMQVFSVSHEPEPGRWTFGGATVTNAGRRPRSARTIRSMLRQHRRGRFDVIHTIAYNNRTAAIGAAASLLLGVPLVLTLADGEVVGHPSIGFGGQLTWRSRLALRVAARRAGVVTTQSDFVRHHAARLNIAARTVILGVDLQRWPMLEPRRRAANAPLRFLHVGRFTAVKDHMTLLEAMAILQREGLVFELHLVGEGAFLPPVRQAVARLGLEPAVRISAPVPYGELRISFEHADLLLVSSIHESGPMVVLEAAIAGIPTVGTAVGYVADWAPQAAVAVAIGDAAALASALKELAGDEERRLHLAAAAKDFAARCDADFTATTFAEIYRDLA